MIQSTKCKRQASFYIIQSDIDNDFSISNHLQYYVYGINDIRVIATHACMILLGLAIHSNIIWTLSYLHNFLVWRLIKFILNFPSGAVLAQLVELVTFIQVVIGSILTKGFLSIWVILHLFIFKSCGVIMSKKKKNLVEWLTIRFVLWCMEITLKVVDSHITSQ